MPKEQSSEELSSLAARILNMEPLEGELTTVEDFNDLLVDAKRLAGSVLSQDETPEEPECDA